MKRIKNGILEISEDLVFSPTFTFEDFTKTKFFDNQKSTGFFYLKESQTIDNRNYHIGISFIDGFLYMILLICCDENYDAKDEANRKILHDKILKEIGINEKFEAAWGHIISKYDQRSNISSIGIYYAKKNVNEQ